jgi:hypothetical protein
MSADEFSEKVLGIASRGFLLLSGLANVSQQHQLLPGWFAQAAYP